MKAGMAFWAGVIGAAVMVLGMWSARVLDVTGFDFGYFWGSMLTGTAAGGTWIIGFVITLILGGMYIPLHKKIVTPRGRMVEERREREEVMVPPAPEDRSEAKLGRGRRL